MKVGVASAVPALATACLFAAPASSGASPPPSQAAPAALGRIPSGEIEFRACGAGHRRAAPVIAPRDSRPFGRADREWVADGPNGRRDQGASIRSLEQGRTARSTRKGASGFSAAASQGDTIERDCAVPEGTAFVALTSGSVSTPEVACIAADDWYKASRRTRSTPCSGSRSSTPSSTPRSGHSARSISTANQPWA